MTIEMQNKITDSELLLIGIGKEWEENFDAMNKDPFYSSLIEQLSDHEQEARAQLGYLKCHYLRRYPSTKILKAYEALHTLTEGKDYFIVSVCTDDLIYASSISAERFVAPCGGFRRLICCEPEHETGAEETENFLSKDQQTAWIDAIMEQIDTCNGDLKKVVFPVCEKCGKILEFNRVTVPGYQETEYLDMWKKYTTWLQGTLNRRLCVLETGVGMEYPSVIRFPFEKAAYFNQKACLIRIHSYLYHLPQELKERGISIAQHPIDFLLHSMS